LFPGRRFARSAEWKAVKEVKVVPRPPARLVRLRSRESPQAVDPHRLFLSTLAPERGVVRNRFGSAGSCTVAQKRPYPSSPYCRPHPLSPVLLIRRSLVRAQVGEPGISRGVASRGAALCRFRGRDRQAQVGIGVGIWAGGRGRHDEHRLRCLPGVASHGVDGVHAERLPH
jgi:hypothetical protein